MKKVIIAGMIVAALVIAGCVGNPGEVTPSRTPTVTDEPVKARWIEATANGDQVSIPVSEVQENRNIHFKVSSEKRVMNFMAYEVGDKIFVRGNVCPPCRSKGFSLQNEILVCDSCATTFEALTGDGVAGACVDYPKEAVPHIIEGKNIVMEMNDLTRSYEKTLERG